MPDWRHFDDYLRRWNGGQISHAHQVVDSADEGKNPVHVAHSTMPQFRHKRNCLQPAEAFVDPLPLSLADGIPRMPRGATINRASARPFVILRHMRYHSQIPILGHKPERVKPLVAPTVTDCVPASFSSMMSAPSRSAVPLA
jgi:hypothetical protein